MTSNLAKSIEDPRGCRLCPRACGADRSRPERSDGFCRAGSQIYVARAAAHFWEEPCLSGQRGSGTVFFSGCSLGCVFCQNREISRPSPGRPLPGKPVSPGRLAEIFLELQERGVHNINLVTPSHFAPQIAAALRQARRLGLILPVVYNSGGYDRPETLALLDGQVNIYLPDFKYWSGELAGRYSKAPDYPAAARQAIAEMYRQVGPPRFDSQGMMTGGLMVRLLLLPGCLEDAKAVLSYLFSTYANGIFYSVMNQYTPPPSADLAPYPELSRPVASWEYEALLDYAEELGIENAFIQEGGAVSESFIPAFDGSGL